MIRLRCDGLASLHSGDTVDLDRAESTHLFKILRASEGDRVVLLNGHGLTGAAVVGSGRTVVLESLHTVEPPKRRIHLYLAPPRRQKMDQI